jgi:hypothetical protein
VRKMRRQAVIYICRGMDHRRMARGSHGLPKVSPGSAMPYPFTPVSGVAHPQGRWPVAVFYPLGHFTPYAYGTAESTDHDGLHCGNSQKGKDKGEKTRRKQGHVTSRYRGKKFQSYIHGLFCYKNCVLACLLCLLCLLCFLTKN